MVSEEQRQTESKGLVTIKVDNLKARIAADLAETVIQRLKQHGHTVVVIKEEEQ